MSRTWLPKVRKQISGNTTRSQTRWRKPRYTRLGVEALEGRVVPSGGLLPGYYRGSGTSVYRSAAFGPRLVYSGPQSVVQMIAVGGGVDTLFCGGGVYFSPDGNNLGGGGSTFPAHAGSQRIAQIVNAGRGVDALFSNGSAYYSPDGRNLGGGGNTIPAYGGAGIITSLVPALGGAVDALFSDGSAYYSPDGKNLGGGGSTIRAYSGAGVITSLVPALGGAVDALFSNGSAYYSPDGSGLGGTGSTISAYSGAGIIKAIVPALGGAVDALFSNGSAYYRPDGKNLGGAGNTISAYVGAGIITSLVPALGGAVDALFSDGSAYYSPDGKGLGGGGTTQLIDIGVISFNVAPNGTLTIHDYLNTYGFNFRNFNINDSEPGISWGIVKGEFGGDQVDITAGIPFTSVQIDTGIPSPFGLAYWGAAAIAFNGGGACFGMALTSEKMAASGQNVYNLPETGALVTTIEENHLAQWSAEMVHYAAGWALRVHSPLGIYNQLSTLLASGDHPIITLSDGGAHAVVAYGLQPGPKGDGDFYIDVCDSNFPAYSSNGSNLGIEMFTRIYIDPSSGWSYAPYGWSGSGYGATSLMVIPGSVLSGSLNLPDSLSGLGTIIFGSCPPSALAGVVQLNQPSPSEPGPTTVTMPGPSDEPAATLSPSSGNTLAARLGQSPLGLEKPDIASGAVSPSDPFAAAFLDPGSQAQGRLYGYTLDALLTNGTIQQFSV